jgi:hypothetical protein
MGRLTQIVLARAFLAMVYGVGVYGAGVILYPLAAAGAGDVTAYNPPVPSRWTIVAERHEEKTQDGKIVATATSRRKEDLTIVEKTATGYRISFVLRSFDTDGDTNESIAEKALLGGLRDVTVRAVLDEGGKPLRLENLEEVVAAHKQAIDRVIAAFSDKPAAAAKIRELFGMISVTPNNPDETAAWYLETVTLLSAAQNTGLRVGEERREAKAAPNPLGGDPIKTDVVSRLVEADPATGRAKLIRTVIYDPVLMKELTVTLMKKIIGAAPPEAEKVMKDMSIAMEGSAEFTVEGGMTRSITEDSAETIKALGHAMSKHERNQVTITPMP